MGRHIERHNARHRGMTRDLVRGLFDDEWLRAEAEETAPAGLQSRVDLGDHIAEVA